MEFGRFRGGAIEDKMVALQTVIQDDNCRGLHSFLARRTKLHSLYGKP